MASGETAKTITPATDTTAFGPNDSTPASQGPPMVNRNAATGEIELDVCNPVIYDVPSKKRSTIGIGWLAAIVGGIWLLRKVI